jgi:DNA-binding MarR family transcriptional regulator
MPRKLPQQPAEDAATYFRLLNEIGIIAQLSATRLERVLPHGLTSAQFSFLNHCVRLGDGWTPARLAAAFQVTRGTMTNTLQKLETKGFIRTETDQMDARSKHVYLTPAGRAARDEALARLAPELARLPEALPQKEAAALIPSLEVLRIWLDANR